MSNLMPIRAAPFAHQQAAFDFALSQFVERKNYAALLMEMGTGKSLVAIAVAGRLYLEGKIGKTLIVAPLSILSVWEQEFVKFANFDYVLAVLDGNMNMAKKADTLRHLQGKPLQVAVVNYESAKCLETEILKWKPGLCVADEGHKMKSRKTDTSRCMHRLGFKIPYRLLLTGTLVGNHAEDIFSQYKFLTPAIFGTSFHSWQNRYFDACGYGGYNHVLKPSMEEELMKKVHRAAFCATKAECLDLPETTDIIRFVELEENAAKLYRKVVKDCYAELESGEISVTNILTKILRLSQITGGFVTDDDGKISNVSKAKLDALSEIIESIRQGGKKAVVIAKFTPEIGAIERLLKQSKIGYAVVSGATKDRGSEVERFQADPECEVFIGQIACASLGITLTAASDLIFYSLDYSTANHSQARSRVHRNGQTQPCAYYYLQAKGTIDEKVLKALRDKSDLAKTLIDDFRAGNNPFN